MDLVGGECLRRQIGKATMTDDFRVVMRRLDEMNSRRPRLMNRRRSGESWRGRRGSWIDRRRVSLFCRGLVHLDDSLIYVTLQTASRPFSHRGHRPSFLCTIADDLASMRNSCRRMIWLGRCDTLMYGLTRISVLWTTSRRGTISS